ncbi:sigma-54 interaction domain-containing protein [Rhodothermus marinus]|uniref:sigma-54 interaction domain-containing protein n=1 Tax=Rhodothermus marinus TaxID=29549 RepID=UPI000AAF6449|nr:sigma 54-interacting transcriptional regulator [Rhodothermus marinus]
MDREAIQQRFGIVGQSAAIRNVIDRARMVARTDITVLLQGESGVGKELIAHAIHGMSPRRHGPFVIVNCGAIPEGLLESELFGAEKGAYTGAVERRKGYFEEADGGTIFLDEIGEMPLAAQVRLLRVLETGEFTRVGSSRPIKTDVRIIAATNKDLAKAVRAGHFREDLYYRISTVIIEIPPLRERREDIIPLFEYFLHRAAQRYGTPLRRLDESARQLLLRYHWPGNVRELRNVAEQVAVLLTKNTITAEDLRPLLRGVSAGRSLMPVSRASEHGGDPRERELIYRLLLELRSICTRSRRCCIGWSPARCGDLSSSRRRPRNRPFAPRLPGRRPRMWTSWKTFPSKRNWTSSRLKRTITGSRSRRRCEKRQPINTSKRRPSSHRLPAC